MTAREFNPGLDFDNGNAYRGDGDCPVLEVKWEPDYDHEGFYECSVRIRLKDDKDGFMLFHCPEHAVWICQERAA